MCIYVYNCMGSILPYITQPNRVLTNAHMSYCQHLVYQIYSEGTSLSRPNPPIRFAATAPWTKPSEAIFLGGYPSHKRSKLDKVGQHLVMVRNMGIYGGMT